MPGITLTRPNAPARLQSSADWRAYFEANGRSLRHIPWELGACLTPLERAAITTSVQAFQLGETGEGKHLFRCAEDYALRIGDADYLPAVKSFICEEHRHARDLARFMELAGIPRIHRAWYNDLFRRLRKGSGLELSLSVLLTAEIIALVYYAALGRATSSPVLQRLCEQILADEEEHVRFHLERLARMRRNRPGVVRSLIGTAQAWLLCGTSWLVWFEHRRVLRAGGFTCAAFHRAIRREWQRLRVQLEPAGYELR